MRESNLQNASRCFTSQEMSRSTVSHSISALSKGSIRNPCFSVYFWNKKEGDKVQTQKGFITALANYVCKQTTQAWEQEIPLCQSLDF
jgi:hypothetical protein